MQKIGLLVDSACDLSLDIINKKNLKLIPLKIIYSDGEFRDKIEISADHVYDNLETEIPKTSLPSFEDIDKALNSLEEEGFTHVIAITISSGLSGTFNSVRLALEDHPKLISHVFDSKILAMPEGAIVLETISLLESGKSFEEIIETLPALRKRVSGYFTLNTLEYLRKGGRIGKVAGTIGDMLNLKPVISVDDEGVYFTLCKARGRKQSITKLINILKDELEKCPCKVWILQGGALEEAKNILETVKDFNNIKFIDISQISPALGVHTGPGLLGLAIMRDH